MHTIIHLHVLEWTVVEIKLSSTTVYSNTYALKTSASKQGLIIKNIHRKDDKSWFHAEFMFNLLNIIS